MPKTYQIIISEILEHLSTIFDFKSIEVDKEEKKLAYHLLERTKFNMKSISLLVNQNLVDHFHSIGLISRNVITDYLTLIYLRFVSKDKEFDLYRLYNSDLKKNDSLVKLCFNNAIITQDEKDNYFKKYKVENSPEKLIRDRVQLKEFPNTTQIMNTLLNKNHKDQPITKYTLNAFFIWRFYGKYEHIGISSYEFTREIDEANCFDAMKHLLEVVAIISYVCFEFLDDNKKMKRSLAFLEEIKIIH